jgi:hypothetical protein
MQPIYDDQDIDQQLRKWGEDCLFLLRQARDLSSRYSYRRHKYLEKALEYLNIWAYSMLPQNRPMFRVDPE